MNLPNALTILRIFFVPFLVAVLVEQDLRIEWRGAVLVTNAFLALSIFLRRGLHRSSGWIPGAALEANHYGWNAAGSDRR